MIAHDSVASAVDGRIASLIVRARQARASDVHVESGQGAAFRIYTHVKRIEDVVVERDEIAAFIECTTDRLARARLDKIGIADATYADERVGAIRIHASRGKHGPRLAIRLLARAIPELESLRLPADVETFTTVRSGLILICGPTGSGKTTTAAAMIDRINATMERHVVTFEDPIEYTHRWQRSVITQYEVGRDVTSFSEGVRGSLRADPDVLFIGELRGLDTVTACLQAAESGHVVYAALHTPSESAHAINRLVGLFPANEQDAARYRIADTLRGMLGLRLLPLRDGTGLRAAAEIVTASDAVRRVIRDGVTHQLRGILAGARRDGGMQTLESHLNDLVAAGDIDVREARSAALYPSEIVEPLSAAYVRRS